MGRQTASAAEKGLRRMLRDYGFRCEAVSWVRGKDIDEHTAIVCWPGHHAGDVVELFTRHIGLEITRIHIGRETHPGQPPTVRIYVRWTTIEEMKEAHNGYAEEPAAH